MPELLAALVLSCCCLTPAAPHGWHGPADPADGLLAASERQGQEQRLLNYPPSNQEADHG